MWPCPVRSSASTMSPGPTRATVPSPTSISAMPDSVIEYWRRGAQCQLSTYPTGNRRNATPDAGCIAGPSPCEPSMSVNGFIASGSSTRCDLPSGPLYTRTRRAIGALPAVVDLVARVLQPQRRVVGAALRLLRETGVDHAADEHRVVAFFHRRFERALDVGRRAPED